MRWAAVAFLLVLGCKEEQKEKAKDIAGKVKDKTTEVAGEAKEKIVEVAGNAKDKLGVATDKAKEIASATGDVVDGALVKGRAAKTELDKVYKSKTDYALAVDEVGSADAAAHAERLETMPSVDVKGLRVGYEEDSALSLRGTTYMKHFRASWKRKDGKIVRVSFYTKETIDVAAFAALLGKLVPAVEAIL